MSNNVKCSIHTSKLMAHIIANMTASRTTRADTVAHTEGPVTGTLEPQNEENDVVSGGEPDRATSTERLARGSCDHLHTWQTAALIVRVKAPGRHFARSSEAV